MEQQSSTSMTTTSATTSATIRRDFEHIVQNLFNGTKPDPTYTIEDFLEQLSMESEYSVCWKTLQVGEQMLYLFSNEWNLKNMLPATNDTPQSIITKYFNSLIMDSSFNIIMYGGPKVYDSNRDLTTIDKVMSFVASGLDQAYVSADIDQMTVFEAFEGTSINVFNYDSKWYFATKKKFNMFESLFGSSVSHGKMFEDVILIDELITKLNPYWTYHFVIVHPSNTHLTIVDTPKLILTAVRTQGSMLNVDYDTYADMFTTDRIVRPTITTLDALNETTRTAEFTKTRSQGVIIHYKNYIFRVYLPSYSTQLKSNPHFNSPQELYLWNYKNNNLSQTTLEDYRIKTSTVAAFNFVAIVLHRTLLHFTRFAKYFSPAELAMYPTYKFIKINDTDFELIRGSNALIRNIYKLQHLPYAIRTLNEVDFNQVKYHLKYHADTRDIYSMYMTFMSNTQLCRVVGYRKLVGQISDNIDAFAQLV
jgi:hypothetical protein